MIAGAHADSVLLAHMGECLARIADYTQNQRLTFTSSIQVQDAAIRNLQVLTESSQRLSAEIKLQRGQVLPLACLPSL